MRINLTSIHVDDQEKAAAFYTRILGFVKKQDFPMGEFKWLTVVSPEGPDDVELLLEPNDNPGREGLSAGSLRSRASLPRRSTSTTSRPEYERLKGLGVVFTMEPIEEGTGHRGHARRYVRQPHCDLPGVVGGSRAGRKEAWYVRRREGGRRNGRREGDRPVGGEDVRERGGAPRYRRTSRRWRW